MSNPHIETTINIIYASNQIKQSTTQTIDEQSNDDSSIPCRVDDESTAWSGRPPPTSEEGAARRHRRTGTSVPLLSWQRRGAGGGAWMRHRGGSRARGTTDPPTNGRALPGRGGGSNLMRPGGSGRTKWEGRNGLGRDANPSVVLARLA